MKKIFIVFALFGTLVLAACTSGGSSVKPVDPPTFLTTVSQSGVVIVDVRTPSEYAAGHLTGAINIDVEAPAFASQIAALDKATTYAVYCHSGRRSKIATATMAKAGFTHVINLSGGYPDLVAAGASVALS